MNAQDSILQEHINRNDYKTAEALATRRIEENASDTNAHYFLGITYYFQNKIGESIISLKKALDLNPKHTDAAICLSVLYNDIGKYDSAKSVYNIANRSIDPTQGQITTDANKKFATKHLEIADLYFRYRRYNEAIEEYEKASILDPKTPEIHIRKARAYAKKGYVTRAIQILLELKNQLPEHHAARIQLGLFYYSQKNQLDAEIEWEGVLQENPNHKEARSYLEMSRQERLK